MPISSDALPIYKVDDYAYTILAQKISAVTGVSQVLVAGQQDFAVRAQANPAALAAHGIALEDVRNALANATVNQAKGNLENEHKSITIDTNDQLFHAAGYRNIIVAYRNGAPVKLQDVANVIDATKAPRNGAWFNGKRGELLLVFRQPGANTVEVVDNIKAMMPRLLASVPPTVRVDLVSDRSQSIRDFGVRRRVHPAADGRPGGDGDLHLPATSVGHHHSLDHRAAVADRHVRRHVRRWATASTI